MDRPRQTFFLAPVSDDVGLTSMALGLVQALRRDHVAVGFIKPILQPDTRGVADLAPYFARNVLHLETPEPIAYAQAEASVRNGGLDALMEDLVAMVEAAGAGCDAVVIQGLIPFADLQVASQLNAAMARSFAASLVPVLSGTGQNAEALGAVVDLTVRQFADGEEPPPVAGVLVNRLKAGPMAGALGEYLPGSGGRVPVLGDVPFEPKLTAPRLQDVVEALSLGIEQEGNLARARVQHFVTAGRGVDGVIDRLRPGTLVVAAGERSDIILATALAHMQGMPLAGLLLTCGTRLSPQVASMLRAPQLAGLPILTTHEDTFASGALLAGLSRHVRRDDTERMEQSIAHTAEHIDTGSLRSQLGRPGRLRMPPPAFRHRLVQAAREAAKRIVLPEGDEPRTLQAAAICQRKGIAQCVLLGNPDHIRQVAETQGVVLPPDIEIIDPMAVRGQYVAPMCELRRSKGLTAVQAEHQLEDTVVLGTMMLAQDDVDGLVSGAVHTTANTIRPALQLIRTAPGSSIVSSVFFMLMPNEVLVYGDCAVNPDPTAEELADIAIQSADSAVAFGIDPRVAMISYSTGSSGSGADVDKVRRALEIARGKRPDLLIDGPLQYDAASVASVGRQKAPDSVVAGRANVFVFPDLNTGNTTYKAVQRSAHVVSIGPMLQGLRKPVNDLSRGALVDDIVYTIALTAIQAQQANAKRAAAAAQQAALTAAAD
ncbi:phosphate acetyltransferase [Rhodovastum atsumiense]|uniref:Phosphate acetyltransferase n=1 Tax=Rhodovastum atsumiense TaxID=504468 RepID=A0A5M6J277_9PROT|nr:phosphate acetyltransferase [Rhodovastum atsumiense]KAA5613725.1 phosphate acetyltransferase [Rhodovastum atsumiense]CAH2599649.1 phosphate acetyltransferase [Rhodovastum atsumiense]